MDEQAGQTDEKHGFLGFETLLQHEVNTFVILIIELCRQKDIMTPPPVTMGQTRGSLPILCPLPILRPLCAPCWHGVETSNHHTTRPHYATKDNPDHLFVDKNRPHRHPPVINVLLCGECTDRRRAPLHARKEDYTARERQ